MRNEKRHIIEKKWMSKSSKSFQSSWKVTKNGVPFEQRCFSSNETIFHLPKWKKYALAGFSKFDTVPVSKLKWEGDLLLILRVINFLRFSSQWFRRARQIQVNIQGVKHWTNWPRLYKKEDTQCVIQQRQQLRKLCSSRQVYYIKFNTRLYFDFHSWVYELLMSLKTWASGKMARASKI